MKREKLKLGLTLFALGFSGVLSILTMQLPMDKIPAEMLEQFSVRQIKLLTLINPTILLIVAVVIGTVLHDKVNLTVPAISGWLRGNVSRQQILAQIKSGVTWGIISGITIVGITAIFASYISDEFSEIGGKFKLSIITRFFYGGFTEEILMRYGLMTLFVWATSKVFRALTNTVYLVGIILAALIFAAGHMPLAFVALSQPPSSALLIFILTANAIPGIIFGWLYWKRGLEAAFVAHMFAHVIILISKQFMTLHI